MSDLLYLCFVEVHCNKLNPVKHSQVGPKGCLNETSSLETRCEIKCKDGFQQTGPTNYTCVYEGKTFWTPEVMPVCKGKESAIQKPYDFKYVA